MTTPHPTMVKHFFAALITVAAAAAATLLGYLVLILMAVARGEAVQDPLYLVLLPLFASAAAAAATFALVMPVATFAWWLCTKQGLSALIPPLVIVGGAAIAFLLVIRTMHQPMALAIRSMPDGLMAVGVLALLVGPTFAVYWPALWLANRRELRS